jgi:hypothetical protein
MRCIWLDKSTQGNDDGKASDEDMVILVKEIR